jgi:ABC-type proline/glycine betaine transport system permease subunit
MVQTYGYLYLSEMSVADSTFLVYKVPYDRCIACCVRVGCWNQQCKTITYIVSAVICISEGGLLHVWHANASSKQNSR